MPLQFTDDGTTITYSVPTSLFNVARLTYEGGGDYLAKGIGYEDLPQVGDFFLLYPSLTGPLMRITCADGTTVCTEFAVRLLQDLQLQGPFIYTGSEGFSLDDGTARICEHVMGDPVSCTDPRPTRVNQACIDSPDGSCGLTASQNFIVSSAEVPEPQSLALVGRTPPRRCPAVALQRGALRAGEDPQRDHPGDRRHRRDHQPALLSR